MEILYYIIGIVILGGAVSVFSFSRSKKDLEELILEEENFNISHKYLNGVSKTATAVDSENKKIIFIEGKNKTVINFKDLISVETIVNNQVLHQTKRGSQVAGGVVGGLLLGPAGLLIGALTGGKKVVHLSKDIQPVCLGWRARHLVVMCRARKTCQVAYSFSSFQNAKCTQWQMIPRTLFTGFFYPI
jgi:hypothetical protein